MMTERPPFLRAIDEKLRGLPSVLLAIGIGLVAAAILFYGLSGAFR